MRRIRLALALRSPAAAGGGERPVPDRVVGLESRHPPRVLRDGDDGSDSRAGDARPPASPSARAAHPGQGMDARGQYRQTVQ